MSVEAPVMRAPRTVDVDLTARCNLRCRYCYFFDNPAVPYQDLPTDEWLRFFDELGGLGVMDVVLAGGEPFLRRDLGALLSGIVRNRMRFAVLSNGALVDDQIAASVAATGRCNYVQVSIDGSRPETHDACRGEGSFAAAVRGLDLLRRHGVNVTARVTVHRHNVDDLEATARLLLEELGLASFGSNSAGYLGSCRLNADVVQLTTAQRQAAMGTLARLAERYPGRVHAAAGPLAEAGMWRRMEEARANASPPFPNGGHLTACGCHRTKIAVRADGAIVPCNMLPGIELGRINRDALAEVWQRHPALAALRRRHTIPLTGFAFCDGCEYLPYCTGNCPALACSLTGQVDHPSPDGCLRRFKQDGGRVPGCDGGDVAAGALLRRLAGR